MINGLYTYAATAIVAGALAFGAGWQVQEWRYGKQIADIQAQHAQASLKRSEVARADEAATAGKESAHAAATQENSDAFTTSQPARDAIARADIALADRLRTAAERRIATYRQIAASCTTASSGIADRLEAFDRHIIEGASVVAEHRQALVRRDSEVKLLRGQIDADRLLLADPK